GRGGGGERAGGGGEAGHQVRQAGGGVGAVGGGQADGRIRDRDDAEAAGVAVAATRAPPAERMRPEPAARQAAAEDDPGAGHAVAARGRARRVALDEGIAELEEVVESDELAGGRGQARGTHESTARRS